MVNELSAEDGFCGENLGSSMMNEIENGSLDECSSLFRRVFSADFCVSLHQRSAFCAHNLFSSSLSAVNERVISWLVFLVCSRCICGTLSRP